MTRRFPVRRIALVLVALAAVAFLGYRVAERTRVPAAEPEKPLPVTVLRLAEQPFTTYLGSVGTVTAERRIMLSSRLSATVREIPHREGDRVEKGELLARLDDREAKREVDRSRSALERAEADLAYWQRELEADARLHREEMLDRRRMEDTRRRVATTKASVKEAHAALELARLRVEWTQVTAPWDGFVQARRSREGEQARPGTPLVEFVAADPLKVVAPLAESDMKPIRQGLPARVRIPALERAFDVSVDRIHPALDTATRNATVEIELPRDEEGLRPGMAAEVRLITSQSDTALVVPRHAVRSRDGRPGLFVAVDGTARWRPVTTGPARDQRIAIETGVEAGERVITTPHPGLADGRRIRADRQADTARQAYAL